MFVCTTSLLICILYLLLQPGTIKGSKLSETWGKMKVKLANKDTNSNMLTSAHKNSKRHRSAGNFTYTCRYITSYDLYSLGLSQSS